MIALFQVQTVNLAKIASVFGGTAKIASNYKKLQRFFRFFSFSQAEVARLVLRLLKIEPNYTIAIDRTEWQLGASWVNVLMLSVAYKSLSLPLFWIVLDEKGCSDNAERREILQKFIDEFERKVLDV